MEGRRLLSIPHITDKELLEEIMRRTGIPRRTCLQAIRAHYDIIKECLEAGVSVRIASFGVFTLKDMNPLNNRKVKNMHTGEDMYVTRPGYRTPAFKPTKEWKARMKKNNLWNYDENNEKEYFFKNEKKKDSFVEEIIDD